MSNLLARERKKPTPVLGFKCKVCLNEYALADVVNLTPRGLDALAHFERAHAPHYVTYRDFLFTMALDEDKSRLSVRRNGSAYTASMAGGCHREYALRRTVDYWLDPHRLYARTEGQLIHESLKVPTAEREVEFPDTAILGGQIEVSGVADRIEPGVILDLKSHACPSWKWVYPTNIEKSLGKRAKKVYDRKVHPLGEGVVLQVNILMRLVEEVRQENIVYQGEILTIFNGCGDRSLANRLEPVERLSDADLLARLLPNYTLLKRVMAEPSPMKRLTLIADMELAGRHMLNSRDGSCKCDLYCDVRFACDGLLPADEQIP